MNGVRAQLWKALTKNGDIIKTGTSFAQYVHKYNTKLIKSLVHNLT